MNARKLCGMLVAVVVWRWIACVDGIDVGDGVWWAEAHPTGRIGVLAFGVQ